MTDSLTGIPGRAGRESRGRFLLYSHDGLGLGHLRRNQAIATALTQADPRAAVLLVSGCDDLGAHGLAPNVDALTLPGIRKVGNGRYSARRLPLSGNDLRAVRSAQIEAAVSSYRPDVVLADKHPAGVRGELRPALERLAQLGGRAVLGFRDILDEPGAVRAEWSASGVPELAERWFDRILVYGDRRVLDFGTAYNLPPQLAARTSYCGYVVHPEANQSVAVDALPAFATRLSRRPVVLATAGGGEDGLYLLEAFVQAACEAPWDGVVVTGPQLSAEDRHAVRHRAIEAGVEFHGSVPDVSSWFGHVDALVSMGGYNTIGEALSRGTPTVCVPRVEPRTEQLIRARTLARLGLLRLLEPELLEPYRLRAEVAALLGTDRRNLASRAHAALSFDGAERAATELLELASAKPGDAGADSIRREMAEARDRYLRAL